MPTYVYETTGNRPRRFEVKQGMNDAPLTSDPETGEPVPRVIRGGFGYIGKAKPGAKSAKPAGAPARGGHSCGSGCGCH